MFQQPTLGVLTAPPVSKNRRHGALPLIIAPLYGFVKYFQ
jgi:hypothetical protein